MNPTIYRAGVLFRPGGLEECFDQWMNQLTKRRTFWLKERPYKEGVLLDLDDARVPIVILTGYMH